MATFDLIRSFSTVTCGLLLGSTAWAGAAVMPSLIAADISSASKLSVFDGLIVKAGLILPPILLSTIGSLGYLAYHSVGEARLAYAVATGSLLAVMGLQVVVVPKNKHMQDILRTKEAEKESVNGAVADDLIGEILYWNWARVALSAIALGALIYAGEGSHFVGKAGDVFEQVVAPTMAARRLEYGLE